MPEQPPRAETLFEPALTSWPALLRPAPAESISRDTRALMGLPTVRPVVMAGHQPGFWHPGILAKWIATRALAEQVGGEGAWVVVDQSPGAGAEIAYPATIGDHLARRTIALGVADVPPASQAPGRPGPVEDAALPGVQEGLARIASLLEAWSHEPTLAAQLHGACAAALGDDLALSVCFATGLHATPAFAEMVGAMRADPRTCAGHYNEAARRRPESGVRELATNPATVELPLWERGEGPGPWRTVTSDRLADLPDDRIVLRGLPMTGLLRWRACDMFIHGTGGGASHAEEGYDRVTEEWLSGWLGASDLAPAVVASTTARLDFGPLARDIPTPATIAKAQALAHRAAHDPALLGDQSLGERKRELVARIAALPRGDQERAALFAQIHQLRRQSAEANGERLEQVRAHAAALSARADEAKIVADRTWPWIFHPPGLVGELRSAIGEAFDPPG